MPLQSFTATEARRETAIRAARASRTLLAVRIGLMRAWQWRFADRGAGFEILTVPLDRGDMLIDPRQSAKDQVEVKSQKLAVGAPLQVSETQTAGGVDRLIRQ